VAAPADVLEEVASQRRRAERDRTQRQLKSDADKLDEQLTDWINDHVALMAKSADLRAQLFYLANSRLQRKSYRVEEGKYFYELVEKDVNFSRDCLFTLFRLFQKNGAKVVCYWTPRRPDLRPLLDPVPQQEFITSFTKEATGMGVTVLDARNVVPAEYWGWVYQRPDHSHFVEGGHQRLAEFLLNEAEQRGVWQGLVKP
jgi:hypothetical protein